MTEEIIGMRDEYLSVKVVELVSSQKDCVGVLVLFCYLLGIFSGINTKLVRASGCHGDKSDPKAGQVSARLYTTNGSQTCILTNQCMCV